MLLLSVVPGGLRGSRDGDGACRGSASAAFAPLRTASRSPWGERERWRVPRSCHMIRPGPGAGEHLQTLLFINPYPSQTNRNLTWLFAEGHSMGG